MGENQFGGATLLGHGVLLAAAMAYWLLQPALMRAEGRASQLARATGSDIKGKVSPMIYGVGIVASWGGGCLGWPELLTGLGL